MGLAQDIAPSHAAYLPVPSCASFPGGGYAGGLGALFELKMQGGFCQWPGLRPRVHAKAGFLCCGYTGIP